MCAKKKSTSQGRWKVYTNRGNVTRERRKTYVVHLVRQFGYFRIMRAWSNRYCTRSPSTARGEKAREKKNGLGKSHGRRTLHESERAKSWWSRVRFVCLFDILCYATILIANCRWRERGKKKLAVTSASPFRTLKRWTIVLVRKFRSCNMDRKLSTLVIGSWSNRRAIAKSSKIYPMVTRRLIIIPVL